MLSPHRALWRGFRVCFIGGDAVGTSRACWAPPEFRGPRLCTHKERQMLFILWLIAVVLVVWGIVTLIRGQALMGIVLIILGLLVGPGGVSIFN